MITLAPPVDKLKCVGHKISFHLPATFISVVLLFATTCPLAAGQQGRSGNEQQSVSARIDTYIRAQMRRQQIPGVSFAAVRNGKIVLLRSYGFSNVEHQVPVKPQTVFQSGSIGKQFTATAVMILVEEGKLSLGFALTHVGARRISG